MKPSTLWLACMLLCSCATEPAPAPAPKPSTPSISSTPIATERLKVLPPEGWHRVYQFNNVTSRVVGYVPIGETSTDWNAKLTFESFTSLPDSDPVEMLAHEVLRDVDRCTFVQHFDLYSGSENNYPTSVRLFMCGKNETTKKGEIKIMKAIQGKQYFYVIKLISRIEPFEVNAPDFSSQIVATWSTYLKGITLCDSTEPDHPC